MPPKLIGLYFQLESLWWTKDDRCFLVPTIKIESYEMSTCHSPAQVYIFLLPSAQFSLSSGQALIKLAPLLWVSDALLQL